jgi:hypothetical protein
MSIAFPLLIAASKIADLFNARPLGAGQGLHGKPFITFPGKPGDGLPFLRKIASYHTSQFSREGHPRVILSP